MGARCHFAYRDPTRFPGDDVTTVGDIHLGLVIGSFDAPTLVNRIQLGMQRPAEHMKRQFSDFGTNRKHSRVPYHQRVSKSGKRIAWDPNLLLNRITRQPDFRLQRMKPNPIEALISCNTKPGYDQFECDAESCFRVPSTSRNQPR